MHTAAVYTPAAVEFEWDDANEDHIARHGVSPEEVQEAFEDPNRINVDVSKTERERRWALAGRTGDGRLLVVIFTRRLGIIRVVTALDATLAQERRYRRARRHKR